MTLGHEREHQYMLIFGTHFLIDMGESSKYSSELVFFYYLYIWGLWGSVSVQTPISVVCGGGGTIENQG